MKKIISLICLCSLIGCLPVSALNVKEGLEIPVSTEATVSSNNPQQTVHALIKEDVIVNGVVVFKSGDRANLTIADYDKAGAWGIGGKLAIANGYAYDVKGNKHKILVSRNINGKDKNWVKVCCCCGILLWPMLLFGFVHGDEAKLLPTVELDATLSSNFDF